jgi:hypothetical protein
LTAGSGTLANGGSATLDSSGNLTLPGVLTSNGGAAINFTASGAGVENNVLFTDTISDPTLEVRPNQIILTTTATTGNNVEPSLPLISISNINPGIYVWGNSTNGSLDSPGLYGYGAAKGTTAWALGCTVGTTCPGTVWYAPGTEGYCANAGTGELVNCYSLLIHTTGTPAANAEIDHWAGLYDNGGCSSGITAAVCHGLIISPISIEYSGFGAAAPLGMVHARVGTNTATANVYFSGTTMCFASTPTAQIYPYSAITGGGTAANTHYITWARADIPNGNMCATVDVSQTLGTASSPVSVTFTGLGVDYMAQNFSTTGEAGMSYIVGAGTAPAGRTGMRYDSTLSYYYAINLGGTDEVYGFTPNGSTRAGGLAIGYTSITGVPTSYSLTVGANGINTSGDYYAGGTAGVTCSSQNVSSVNGIVTACGGGRTPSTNIVTFTALAKANTATVVAGGAGYLVGDTIPIAMGSYGVCGTVPVLTVATVSTTSVATVTVSTAGSCTALPTAPTAQASTSGVGTGATFQVAWSPIAQVYTPTAGISEVDAYMQGAGGSGGGGALQAASTGASGGGGGGGGGCVPATFSASQIGASQNVTLGLPGLQGTPATSNTTAGGNGSGGSNSTLGALLTGPPGGGGAGGQLGANSGGGGGGGLIAGGNSTNSSGGAAGNPGGGVGGAAATGGPATNANSGAGGGGGAAGGTASQGGTGGSGTGGGSGGGVTTGNATTAGGNGGTNIAAGRTISGGTGGAANTKGGDGTAQTTPQFCQAAGSGGAGGGSGLTTTVAGTGGNGATGSGGGGGGDAYNGVGSTPGWGGLGGLSQLTLIERF